MRDSPLFCRVLVSGLWSGAVFAAHAVLWAFYSSAPSFPSSALLCAVNVITVLHGVGMFPLSEPFLKTRRVSEGGRLTTRQGRRRSALLHGNQRLRDGGWSPLLSSAGSSCYREDLPSLLSGYPSCYRDNLPLLLSGCPCCNRGDIPLLSSGSLCCHRSVSGKAAHTESGKTGG